MKEKEVLIVAAVVCLAASAGAIQTWLAQPRYQEVNPGGAVDVECRVDNKEGECRWEKSGEPIGIFPGKYEWKTGSSGDGDCTLRVFNASLEYDDGIWQCQVTPSSFTAKDALTSHGAQLVVRERPSTAVVQRVGYNGGDQLLTASAGEEIELECIVSGGNPPAKISWFVGSKTIRDGHAQEDDRVAPDARTWVSISRLTLPVSKSDDGGVVRCSAEHPTLEAPLSDQVRLSIHYPPTVRIETSQIAYLEEEKDPATLRCVSDSNPPATILWRKDGLDGIFSPDAEINFSPVTRHTAGLYSCTAENALGMSKEAFVQLDVKHAPSILAVGPSKVINAQMNRKAVLTCEAEGNPPPRYQWLQKLPTQEVLIRGYQKQLVIMNATYDYQGEFVCKATNTINNEERSVQSDGLFVEVSGAPQVMKYSAQQEVRVQTGEDAVLEVLFCSDPKPNQTWHLGDMGKGTGNSIILAAGTGHSRFVAETAKKADREDCYVSSLRINGAHATDSHMYMLRISNKHGSDLHRVNLIVRDHVSQESMIAVAVGAILTLLLLILICIYCCKADSRAKCCPGGQDKSTAHPKSASDCKKGFKPTDLESEKTDVESTHSSSNCSAQNAANANKAIYGRGQGQQSLQGHLGQEGQQGQEVPLTMSIPPDALYGVVEKRNAVIQAPPNHFLQESLTASSSSPSPAASFGSNNPAAFNQYHIHQQQYQHQQHQQQYNHHQQHQQYNHQQQQQQQYYGHGQIQGHSQEYGHGHGHGDVSIHQNPPRIVYNDLCNFPKTSNYGSMKKKKNKDRARDMEEAEEEETYVPGPRIGIYS